MGRDLQDLFGQEALTSEHHRHAETEPAEDARQSNHEVRCMHPVHPCKAFATATLTACQTGPHGPWRSTQAEGWKRRRRGGARQLPSGHMHQLAPPIPS